MHDRAGSALYTVLVLCVEVIEFGSIFELVTNRNASDANIKTASDAVWYTIATTTTVGYGDKYPVTNLGRIVGVLIMVVGVGLFGVLTGYLANTFLAPSRQRAIQRTSYRLPSLRRVSSPARVQVRKLLWELRSVCWRSWTSFRPRWPS